MNKDIRWIQRFQNFERAIKLLKEAFERPLEQMNQLEREGIILRFEYTLELGWKTLKDKMESDGIIIDRISPKFVVKKAFETKYINDIETWLRMIGDRNLLSHTYDLSSFDDVLVSIENIYFPLLAEFYKSLLLEIDHQ